MDNRYTNYIMAKGIDTETNETHIGHCWVGSDSTYIAPYNYGASEKTENVLSLTVRKIKKETLSFNTRVCAKGYEIYTNDIISHPALGIGVVVFLYGSFGILFPKKQLQGYDAIYTAENTAVPDSISKIFTKRVLAASAFLPFPSIIENNDLRGVSIPSDVFRNPSILQAAVDEEIQKEELRTFSRYSDIDNFRKLLVSEKGRKRTVAGLIERMAYAKYKLYLTAYFRSGCTELDLENPSNPILRQYVITRIDDMFDTRFSHRDSITSSMLLKMAVSEYERAVDEELVGEFHTHYDTIVNHCDIFDDQIIRNIYDSDTITPDEIVLGITDRQAIFGNGKTIKDAPNPDSVARMLDYLFKSDGKKPYACYLDEFCGYPVYFDAEDVMKEFSRDFADNGQRRACP